MDLLVILAIIFFIMLLDKMRIYKKDQKNYYKYVKSSTMKDPSINNFSY